MECNVLKLLRERKERRLREEQARRDRLELLECLNECRREMERNDAMFNLLSEPELVESCVFEYRALQARYDGLMRKVREAGCPTVG